MFNSIALECCYKSYWWACFMKDDIICRAASRVDADKLAVLIHDLAAYHGDVATVTPDQLREHGFGSKRRYHAVVAEISEEIIGYALFYVIFNAIYSMVIIDLHHLYVEQSCRRGGVGRALLAEVAKWADDEGCNRIRVGVKPDNASGIAFYRRVGFSEKLPNFFIDLEDFSILAERPRPQIVRGAAAEEKPCSPSKS